MLWVALRPAKRPAVCPSVDRTGRWLHDGVSPRGTLAAGGDWLGAKQYGEIADEMVPRIGQGWAKVERRLGTRSGLPGRARHVPLV
jgi:hypothetical protein